MNRGFHTGYNTNAITPDCIVVAQNAGASTNVLVGHVAWTSQAPTASQFAYWQVEASTNAGVSWALYCTCAGTFAYTLTAGTVRFRATYLGDNNEGVSQVLTMLVNGAVAADVSYAAPGGGTVTSVGLSVPSWLAVSGSPVTGAGTLALSAAGSQAANLFLATPNGSTGAAALRAIGAADLPTATTSAFGAVKPDGTTIVITGGVISAVTSASLPSDYISGCYLTWSSTTQIVISTGSVGLASGSSYTVASAISLTPTLSASTMYYVYLTSASAATVSTTAPSTNYQGTAWHDGTTSHRYVGAFRTDSSSHIVDFIRVGNSVRYRANILGSPYLVLSGGNASSSTSVSVSSVVPATSGQMVSQIYITSPGGNASAQFGCSGGVTPTSSAGESYVSFTGAGGYGGTIADRVLNLTSQAFLYYGGGGYLNIYCLGYLEDR